MLRDVRLLFGGDSISKTAVHNSTHRHTHRSTLRHSTITNTLLQNDPRVSTGTHTNTNLHDTTNSQSSRTQHGNTHSTHSRTHKTHNSHNTRSKIHNTCHSYPVSVTRTPEWHRKQVLTQKVSSKS